MADDTSEGAKDDSLGQPDQVAPPQPDDTDRLSLTAAEREVLLAISAGIPRAEIPETLGISDGSVDVMVRNVVDKLHGLNNPRQ